MEVMLQRSFRETTFNNISSLKPVLSLRYSQSLLFQSKSQIRIRDD